MEVICLIDTHVLLWWLLDDRRLSKVARGLLTDPSNGVFVSSATAWEITTKHRLGRLSGVDALVRDVAGWVARAGFGELPVRLAHGAKAGAWPQKHRDPFDRMLAAQSAIEDVPLVTADPEFGPFGVRTVW